MYSIISQIKKILLVLFVFIAVNATAQKNQSNTPLRVDSNLTEAEDQYMDQQSTALLAEATRVLTAYPPNWPEPAVRKSALMLLDAVFHDVCAPQRIPVQTFLKTRIGKAIDEIEQTKVEQGARIWKLYNHGFIIRTKTVTIGFDLTDGESVLVNGFLLDAAQMDRLAKQCDVLFISHRHSDHADERLAQSFINAGKPVVAPSEVWKNKPIYTSITHLDRVSHTLQLLPIQNGKQVLKVVIYPGHQGKKIENNVALVITPEELSFSQMGNQSNKDDFTWIDEVGKHHKVDVLMPNCWTTDIVRVAKGFQPTLIITGHENELGHTIDHREPYWLSYQRRQGSDRFGGSSEVGYDTPLILMTWGESYHYTPETFNADVPTSKWSLVELKSGELSGYVKVSNPVFSPDGSTIYIPTSTPNGHLFAIDRLTGMINWVFQIPAVTYGGGAVVGYDGTIYQCGTDKKVYAINPDGSLKWDIELDGVIGAFPALSDDGILYCVTNGSTLFAVNTKSSTIKWNQSLNGTTGSAVAIDAAGYVYVGTNSSIVKYNTAGEKQWETTALNVTERGSFAIDGTTLYAALKAGEGIASVNMTNGAVNWTYANGSKSDAYFPIVGTDGTVYFNEKGGSKEVYALNSNGTLKWSTAVGFGMIYGGLALSDAGKLYGGTTVDNVGGIYKMLEIDAATGVITVLLQMTDQKFQSSATIGPDNTLYQGTLSTLIENPIGKMLAIPINGGLEKRSWSMRGRNLQGTNNNSSTIVGSTHEIEAQVFKAYTSGNEIRVTVPVDGEVNIYNALGKIVAKKYVSSGESIFILMTNQIYFIRFRNETSKVIL